MSSLTHSHTNTHTGRHIHASSSMTSENSVGLHLILLTDGETMAITWVCVIVCVCTYVHNTFTCNMTTCPPAAGSWEKDHLCVCVCLLENQIPPRTMNRMLTQNKHGCMLLSADLTEVGVRWNFTQIVKINFLLCRKPKVGASSLLLKPDNSADSWSSGSADGRCWRFRPRESAWTNDAWVPTSQAPSLLGSPSY